MIRVDCHLHTVESGDAVTTLDQLAVRAKEVGLDVVCITDHNQVAAAQRALARDLGVRVVVGEEIRTRSGELIGLFLTERIPYVLPAEMPDFDGPADFLAALATARIVGEYRPHAPRYPTA